MMAEEFKVTPWEVKGDIDYDKLVKDFGVSKIDDAMLEKIKAITGELHPYLRRKIFFAHRDLDFALNEYKKGKNLFMYTGRGPSGKIHVGHATAWWFTKWLQDKFDVELWFQFTDDEKFLFSDKTYQEIQESLYDNMIDVAAMGFNPKKTHFIIDTKHAGLLYPEAIKVAKKLTFSTVKSSFGFNNDQNVGAIFYTSMQAVPAFLPSIIRKKNMACLIPHAIDQDPHFRLTRDILPKLGYYKPASIQCRFMPGLLGINDGKMSSSEGQAIYMTDDAKTVKNKINKYAFSGGKDTVDEHRRHGGNPDIDVAYQWLTYIEDDDALLKRLYDDYKSGSLLSGEMKKMLIDKLNDILAKHQERREWAKKNLDKFIWSEDKLKDNK
ncbi:MAG: tryptophan--tRNA ligase [Candidatus Woesearchaeota archaeon]